ncbi:MAG: DNA recombination/repair protein RecA, partial [Anaerotignum sp.]|nr:DNA recombination/repair protein RecA [Anaerotignum sp.]
SGAWYAYKETRIGQGRENAKQFLRENPDVCQEIENQVREHYDLPVLDAVEAAGADIAEVEL